MTDIDYEEHGLRVGLEFHQRLDTDKLFCSCSSHMKEDEEPEIQINRQIRPSAGELGEVDPAAMKEAIKDKKYIYDTYEDSTCLVETDSEPPHPIDEEAFQLSLTISKMLNCSLYDEVHVMRKTVIDGSNTTGFQRTAMISHNGKIEEPVPVEIEGVFLEEESAGIVGEEKGRKEYRLDRLGIPLVEIATGIIQAPPEKIKKAALEIGTMLRTTGKVKRGIGTIRQDLNISIEEGNRVEVKGVQEIDLLEEIIRKEVKRQLKLIEVKEELEERDIGDLDLEIEDFTDYFQENAPGFIKKAIGKGGGVYGYVAPKFKGIFGKELLPDHRFGTELAHIAESLGVPGIIHTDENMDKYGIEDNMEDLKKDKDLNKDDAVLLIACEDEGKARDILRELEKRMDQATEKVPEETRKAMEKGHTKYLRPLGGEKRMYPETDIPTVKLTTEHREKAEEKPPKPKQIVEELMEKGISEELAEQALKSPRINTIRRLIKETEADPTTIASTLTSKVKEIEEDLDHVKEEHYEEIFKALEEGEFPKDALRDLVQAKARDIKKDIDTLIEEKGLEKTSVDEIKKEIEDKIQEKEELVEENPHRAFKVIMGEIMSKYKGKINGETVSKILDEKLEK